MKKILAEYEIQKHNAINTRKLCSIILAVLKKLPFILGLILLTVSIIDLKDFYEALRIIIIIIIITIVCIIYMQTVLAKTYKVEISSISFRKFTELVDEILNIPTEPPSMTFDYPEFINDITYYKQIIYCPLNKDRLLKLRGYKEIMELKETVENNNTQKINNLFREYETTRLANLKKKHGQYKEDYETLCNNWLKSISKKCNILLWEIFDRGEQHPLWAERENRGLTTLKDITNGYKSILPVHHDSKGKDMKYVTNQLFQFYNDSYDKTVLTISPEYIPPYKKFEFKDQSDVDSFISKIIAYYDQLTILELSKLQFKNDLYQMTRAERNAILDNIKLTNHLRKQRDAISNLENELQNMLIHVESKSETE